MEAIVYVRHSDDCPHKENKFWRRCRCRKWIYVPGEVRRISAKTRSWEQAEREARRLSGAAPVSDGYGQGVRSAVNAYLEDKEQQSLSKSWTYKIKREMESLTAWCDRKGILLLSELSLHNLEDYRKTWTGAAITRHKRQERLRSFFLYCMRHRWVAENTAANLSGIKVSTSPTLPLTRDEFKRVLECAAEYNPRSSDREWRRRRARAMLLLLRWSGLRLGDAARLERSRLDKEGNLLLYMSKTGESVFVPLPDQAVEALRTLRSPNRRYFFWTGTSTKESAVYRWWTTLKAIFKAAGVPDAHPHMLRDTFAIECLLSGVPIDQVSMLLGHSSVKITEKHYSPWVRARQQQLQESVRKSWAVEQSHRPLHKRP
jgi:integrase/recombinase XerD